MPRKFRSEFMSNIEWATNPEEVEITLSDDLAERIPKIAQGLTDMGLFKGVLLNAVEFEFFAGDDYMDEDCEMVPFEPEWRVGVTELIIYSDGDFQVQFDLKHTSEQGFTDYLKPDQGAHE